MSRLRWWVYGGAALLCAGFMSTTVAAAGPAFATPGGLPALPPLYGVSCPTATVCVAVGGSSGAVALRSDNGGRSWTLTDITGIDALYSVSCVSATSCVAVGGNGSGASATGAIATTADGRSWSAVSGLPATPALGDVSCLAGERCLAVGSVYVASTQSWTDAVLASSNGAQQWSAAATPSLAGRDTTLNAVQCVSAQRCLVVGDGAWASDDFGNSWRDIAPPNGCQNSSQGFCAPTYTELTGLDFSDAEHGTVVGGEQCGGQKVTQCGSIFFATSDGGSSWQMWPAANGQSIPFFDAVRCTGATCLAASATFTSWVIELSTSDGSSWTADATGPGQLNALTCAPGGRLCVAVGNSGSAGILEATPATGGSNSLPGAGTSPASGSAPVGAGIADISTISTALPTPASVTSSVSSVVLSAVLVLALVLLVVFPSQLFNRTYEENHERIRAWWQRRLPLHRRAPTGQPSRRREVAAFVAVIVVGALLGTLLDPHVGINARSAALFTGIALALLVFVSVSGLVNATYRRARHHQARWGLRALPSGLLVGAACVLVSRLVNFQPGYLYGVIGGVAFAGALTRNEEGHVVALSSIATLTVSAAAWLVWVPVSHNTHTGGFGAALLADVLSALFVGGLVGTVIGLVPLRFLPGEKLAGWHRGVWTVVFAIALFGLLQIMLRPQSSGAHIASVPLWTTVGLFVVFGTASVAFWWYFRARPTTA